jgi:hypothetical protein
MKKKLPKSIKPSLSAFSSLVTQNTQMTSFYQVVVFYQPDWEQDASNAFGTIFILANTNLVVSIAVVNIHL